MADHCLVTGKPLEAKEVELHHPARDGRPPIPLSKVGHAEIESAIGNTANPIDKTLRALKRQGTGPAA
jgi:hypothetical protein